MLAPASSLACEMALQDPGTRNNPTDIAGLRVGFHTVMRDGAGTRIVEGHFRKIQNRKMWKMPGSFARKRQARQRSKLPDRTVRELLFTSRQSYGVFVPSNVVTVPSTPNFTPVIVPASRSMLPK